MAEMSEMPSLPYQLCCTIKVVDKLVFGYHVEIDVLDH